MPRASKPKPEPAVLVKSVGNLMEFFQRAGYVRSPDPERKQEGASYKKGWEVRIVCRSVDELVKLRKLLRGAELKPGTPFQKHNQFVQPIYGQQAVEQFAKWNSEAKRKASPRKTKS